VDDYISCKSAGFTNDEILNPVQGNGEYAASLPLFGGLNVWKAKNKILDTIAVTETHFAPFRNELGCFNSFQGGLTQRIFRIVFIDDCPSSFIKKPANFILKR